MAISFSVCMIHRKKTKNKYCEDKRNPRCPRFSLHVCKEWNRRFRGDPNKQLVALKVGLYCAPNTMPMLRKAALPVYDACYAPCDRLRHSLCSR